jgi:large subunit ribosomal protein L28
MSRVCYFTGKRTRAGRSIARRGKAKYLGGVGRKTTGVTNRKFKPNVQRVRAVINGKVCRVKASAKAIKMGLVVKPPKRQWKGKGTPHPQTAPGGPTEAPSASSTEAHQNS